MSVKTVAIIQARMNSIRFPKKIMTPLHGAPLLTRMLERVARIRGIDAICLTIPEGPENDPLEVLGNSSSGVVCARGPEHDVLQRTLIAARCTSADIVVRITSDCPLVDPQCSSAVLAAYSEGGHEYVRTSFEKGYPLGFDTEVFAASLLEQADTESQDEYEREHVTPFIWRRPDRYPALYLDRKPDRRDWRLVVDEEPDLHLIQKIYDELYPGNPEFDFRQIEPLLCSRPDWLEINAHVSQTKYEAMPR